MADTVRIIAIGGTVGALIGGGLAAPAFMPSALADEPAKAAISSFAEIFPKPFDPKSLVKFDITYGPGVSTDVQHSSTISKIEYGHRTYVSIVTTPSGTYSSDALVSPYVRYPGIDVSPKYSGHHHWSYSWFHGSAGSGSWTSFTSGSITYFTYSFKPAART